MAIEPALCRCPSCGHRFAPASPEESVRVLSGELREQCERRREWVSPDGRVMPATAALILKKSVGTLANWRSGANPLPFVRGRSGGITYRLDDIAAFILGGGDR